MCPGYVHRPENASILGPHDSGGVPLVRIRAEHVVVEDARRRTERELAELERVGNWTLMATFELDGQALAVLEEVSFIDGRIAFVNDDGVTLILPKSLEPTEEGDQARWYLGHRKEEVLPAGARTFEMRDDDTYSEGQPDILRSEILQGGRDPDPAAVRACFPPIRKNFWEGHERPQTFVGTSISADVLPLYYTDHSMVWRVPGTVVAPEIETAIRSESLWEGIVGGWLPVVRTVYPVGREECWEVVTFAPAEGASLFQQPVWYRYLRIRNGQVTEAKYIDSFLPYPNASDTKPGDFYRSLFLLHHYWEHELEGSMRFDVPENWIEDFSRHALALERITRSGNHPKYGVSDRAYAGEEHDGFQDLLVSTVTANLEWGLFSTARNYLDYYFRHFVRQNGSINYRGPQIGKYGVMLSCLAQYADYSDDYSLILEHDCKIKSIVSLLEARWEAARTVETGNPTYGMIAGYHEADINFLTPTLTTLNYEQPYLANSAQAWRGLRDISLTWKRIGAMRNDSEMRERGTRIESVAHGLFADAQHGVERSWITKGGVTGLPIIAGSNTFYWEAPYRTCPESYDENRVWSELLWSGILPKQTVERIYQIAEERGGTTLGIFTNRYHIVAFLVSEAVHGLLQHNMVPEALLVLYAHAFHAHTRGTWTVRECVDLNRGAGYSTPYCNPAQMTVPTIAKWLLVFEDPVDRTLTLGQGVPRAWFDGGRSFGIRNAPTRWGGVSYSIRSNLGQGYVDVEVTLPPKAGADVRVRLRCPDYTLPEKVDVLDRDDVSPQVEGELVKISVGTSGKITMRVHFSKVVTTDRNPAF